MLDEKLLKEIQEETERRMNEMGENWNVKSFGPAHTYPYVLIQVYQEKMNLNKN